MSAPKSTLKSPTKSTTKSPSKSLPKSAPKSTSKAAFKSTPKSASKSTPKSASKSKPASASNSTSQKPPSPVPVVADIHITSDDDTDLELDESSLLHRTHKDRSNCREMYEAACRHYNTIVSSQFISQMKGNQIHLTDLALGPTDAKAMCIPLLYNTTVTRLDLSGNNLGDKGCVHVMDVLEENLQIEELHLARNNIGRSGAKYICHSLHTNQRLKTLNLSGNKFHDGEAKYFAELLRVNSVIKHLDLSENKFGESSGHVLGAALADNGGLEALDLSWNHIRLQGAVALAKSLRNNDSLRRLDVSWNGFTNEGAAELGQSLTENFTMKELNLTSNRINLVGLGKFAKGMSQNESLQTLKLGRNPILALGADLILQVIKHNENNKVVCLDISDVPVSYNFVASLEELAEQNVGLDVRHDCKIRRADDWQKQQGSLMADPLRVLAMYVRERCLSLVDILVPCTETSDMVLDLETFKAAIKKFSPPLTEPQIESLATRLHKMDDTNHVTGIDISSLVARDTYRQKRTLYLSQLEARAHKRSHNPQYATYTAFNARNTAHRTPPEDHFDASVGLHPTSYTDTDMSQSRMAQPGSEVGDQNRPSQIIATKPSEQSNKLENEARFSSVVEEITDNATTE